MEDEPIATIPREHYLSRLRELRGFPAIKVLVGIRRCGKTTIMESFRDELIAGGVPESRTYSANLENITRTFATPKDLVDDVVAKVGDLRGSYLFLDEIQALDGWESAVSTFHTEGADVYITGSSSKMLSSELSTKLSGRFVEIHVQPLTFSEYLMFREGSGKDVADLFQDYVRHGGFPAVALLEDRSPRSIPDMLSGIYNTVYMKDVVERNRLRDAPLLPHISAFLMKNVGNRTSIRSIANYLSGRRIRSTPDTVDSYVSFMESAMLFSRAKRLDSKTKEYLVTTDKFYVADTGIRNSLVPFTYGDMGGIMENIVYNELVYRHGDVAVCDIGGLEVDFVADPMGRPSYYQVCLDMSDAATVEREVRSLKALDDNYPKTIVTYDRYVLDDIDGIRVVGIVDWLLGKERV